MIKYAAVMTAYQNDGSLQIHIYYFKELYVYKLIDKEKYMNTYKNSLSF